jgi:hypothetical protein
MKGHKSLVTKLHREASAEASKTAGGTMAEGARRWLWESVQGIGLTMDGRTTATNPNCG